jgi:hypothetical protein
MERNEYLKFIATLEQTRMSISAVLDDLSDRPDTASRLKQAVVDLENAIQAYRDKLKARRA